MIQLSNEAFAVVADGHVIDVVAIPTPHGWAFKMVGVDGEFVQHQDAPLPTAVTRAAHAAVWLLKGDPRGHVSDQQAELIKRAVHEGRIADTAIDASMISAGSVRIQGDATADAHLAATVRAMNATTSRPLR